MTVKSELTEYGFIFGAMEVTRTCSDDSGACIVNVKTDKGQLSIRATKTGHLRFFVDNQECSVVDKEYIGIIEDIVDKESK